MDTNDQRYSWSSFRIGCPYQPLGLRSGAIKTIPSTCITIEITDSEK
jgi:hypothetical protein